MLCLVFWSPTSSGYGRDAMFVFVVTVSLVTVGYAVLVHPHLIDALRRLASRGSSSMAYLRGSACGYCIEIV